MKMAGCDARKESQENIFKDLADNIELVSKQIRDGESKREEPGHEFNFEAYWNSVDGILKKLSVETTKISLAFSKKPFPSNKNTEMMVSEMEKAMLSLVSIFYSLPESQGRCVRKTFQRSILHVLGSLKNFAVALSDCLTPESALRLQWTGGVWESTDFTLMKDNKSCLIKNLKMTEGLVKDALGEIDEAEQNDGRIDLFLMDNDDYGGEVWSNEDKPVIEACKGLVKATKAVVKKCQGCVETKGNTSTCEAISSLDELDQLTGDVSKLVDDFVCLIYAPIKYSVMFQNGKNLYELGCQIIKFLRDSQLTSNEDAKWLDFLSQAISHNLDKLKSSTQEHVNVQPTEGEG